MKLRTKAMLLGTAVLSMIYIQCTHDSELDYLTAPDGVSADSELSLRGRDRYVITLKEGVDMETLSEVKGIGKGLLKNIGADQEPEHTYSSALKGFTAYLSPGQVKKLGKLAEIDMIELDEVLTLGPPPGKGWNKTGEVEPEPEITPAQETPWGISRVNGGVPHTGSVAWILDSGIDLDHTDLNIDRTYEFSAYTRGRDAGTDDKNGHGTHVAGTIAAMDNDFGVVGVAAGATVVPVKVLDRSGSGSWSGILAGVDHVARYARPGDVANMSLGGGVYQTLDQAVINAAQSTGVKFVIAAGNSAEDTDNSSPARAIGPNVFTVSAMDSVDAFANFSNYGASVKYCAPGVNILSTWNDGSYHTISGTSMAAPHIAGLLMIGANTIDGNVVGDPDGIADPILVK